MKKEANAKVFESIVADFQRERERELEDEKFVYENERNNFLDKNGESLPYEPLEISVAALQFKYKKLKVICS